MRKKGSVYKKMVLSYILIFAIPIFMGLLFYAYSYRITEQQVNSFNENLLNTIRVSCDGELVYYKNLLLQLSNHENVVSMTRRGEPLDGEDYWNLYVIQNEVSSRFFSLSTGTNYCKDIFIYYGHIDKVVSNSGNMNFETYCSLLCARSSEEAESFQKHLANSHFRELVNLGNRWNDGTEVILMTNWLWGIAAQETGSVVGAWIDAEVFRSKLESADWDDESVFAIVDSQNRMILAPEGEDTPVLNFEELAGNEGLRIEWNGKKYFLTSRDSEVMELKYVLLTPERTISEPARRQRNFFVAGMAICLGIGYWLITRMIKVNYNPLKNLMALFDKQEKSEYMGDEYQYLKARTISLLGEKEEIEHAMKQSSNAAKQYYLIHYLTNSCDESSRDFERACIKKEFLSGKNLVLLIVLSEPGNAENDEHIQTDSMKRFIVSNVMEELIGEVFVQETLLLGDKVTLIINMQKEDDYKRTIREKVDYAQSFIHDNFGFSITIFSGVPHEGINGMHQSYLEACEAERLWVVLEEDYISYDEICDCSVRTYFYSMETEGYIINAIQSCNSGLAISLVNKVLDVNFLENKVTPEMRKCLLYDLSATLLKTAGEMGRNVEELIDLRELTGNISLDRIRIRLVQAIEGICEKSDELKEHDKTEMLCLKVVEYIKQNYQNPDLNISQTAFFFGKTPAYLATLYKKQTGKSLMKVINQVRIDEAKKLLLGGMSVADVTKKVGFRDDSTFIRAFKRYEGVTPGQFKEIDENRKHWQ